MHVSPSGRELETDSVSVDLAKFPWCRAFPSLLSYWITGTPYYIPYYTAYYTTYRTPSTGGAHCSIIGTAPSSTLGQADEAFYSPSWYWEWGDLSASGHAGEISRGNYGGIMWKPFPIAFHTSYLGNASLGNLRLGPAYLCVTSYQVTGPASF